MIPERRRFSRLYLFLGAELTYNRQELRTTKQTVLLVNLSTAGLRFLTQELLEEGAPLELSVSINDLQIPISAEGVVVWQKKISLSFFDTSVKFTHLSDKNRDVLISYIESIKRKNS